MKSWNRTPWHRFIGFVVCAIVCMVLYSALMYSIIHEVLIDINWANIGAVIGIVWGATLFWIRGSNKSKLHTVSFILLNGILYRVAFQFLPSQGSLMLLIYLAIIGALLAWIYEALLGKKSQSTAFLAFMSVASPILPYLIIGLFVHISSYFSPLSIFFWQIGMGIVFSLDTAQDRKMRGEEKGSLIDQIGKDA